MKSAKGKKVLVLFKFKKSKSKGEFAPLFFRLPFRYHLLMKTILKTSLLLLLLTSCASTNVEKIFNEELKPIEVDFQSIDLSLVDNRENIKDEDLPMVGFPGKTVTFESYVNLARLEPKLKELYRIKNNPKGENISLILKLTKVEKTFSSNMFNVEEKVRVEVALHADAGKVFCDSTGFSEGLNKSVGATDDALERMVIRGIQVAFYKSLTACLERL